MSGDFMVGFSKVSALVCLLCKVTVESTFSELGPYSVKRDLLQCQKRPITVVPFQN
jgi:hypothetical protein